MKKSSTEQLSFFKQASQENLKPVFPTLKIIAHKATPEEKAEIRAFASYHLIIQGETDQPIYSLGFCRKKPHVDNVEYATKLLDHKSALYRWITENSNLVPTLKKEGMDLTTRHYVEEEAREAEGMVRSLLETLEGTNFVTETIKKELFQQFLFYVSIGEQKKVEEILGFYPQFLLSEHQGDVKSLSGKLTFQNTTGFKLAVCHGDWHMYKMMLQHIPEKQYEMYKADLSQQFNNFQKEGLVCKIDSLSLWGQEIDDVLRNMIEKNQGKKRLEMYLHAVKNFLKATKDGTDSNQWLGIICLYQPVCFGAFSLLTQYSTTPNLDWNDVYSANQLSGRPIYQKLSDGSSLLPFPPSFGKTCILNPATTENIFKSKLIEQGFQENEMLCYMSSDNLRASFASGMGTMEAEDTQRLLENFLRVMKKEEENLKTFLTTPTQTEEEDLEQKIKKIRL